MAERSPAAEILIGRAVFVAAVALTVFVSLLPLGSQPRGWAPPDLILAFTLAWVARRPDFVPVALIAAVFLMLDLLYQRPPGLWAGIVVVVTEILRRRSGDLRAVPFSVEWATAALAIVAICLGYRAMLAVAFVPAPPLSLSMIEMVLTVLVYPVAAFVSWIVFGVRRPAPGEVDSLGHRL
ncbi:rod shape-determining protein MreD [Histidinibacterium lentulum]|uniref:Rod shape-determining protein MreD n=1 Tax=Histidinibacterium lentulum TaxID=2480588 RepID=A0A3N2R4J3_9RHOB|nr:rod shape-determining protein MreD [Histidinibacterium lentulum]ROU02415.1 rod shape-determining protein MreD [Histidinibacterium lentulum]